MILTLKPDLDQNTASIRKTSALWGTVARHFISEPFLTAYCLLQDKDGSYFISQWRPSSYTESVALNYNPLIPVLGYVWCRSFEPLAGWLCVVLMVAFTGILHLMVARMKFLLTQEKLFRGGASQHEQTGISTNSTEVPSGDHFEPPSWNNPVPNSPNRAYQPMVHAERAPQERILASPIQQSPFAYDRDTTFGSRRVTASPPHYKEENYAEHHQLSNLEEHQQIQQNRTFPSTSQASMRASAYPTRMATPASVHIERPAPQTRTPQTTPFGLRFGARSLIDEPQPSEPHPSSRNGSEHSPYVRSEEFASETAPSPSRYPNLPAYRTTPFTAAPPPPSYSLQDFS